MSDRERQISYDIIHMWNLSLKNGTNELIYKIEAELLISKTNLWFYQNRNGMGRDKSGA